MIPIPDGKNPNDLDIYYFSESDLHRGWYVGKNVVGWMVPDSRVTVTADGQTYIQIEVNHSGVLQLGQAVKVNLAGAGTLDLGADGSKGQWLQVIASLALLSALFAGLKRRGKTIV